MRALTGWIVGIFGLGLAVGSIVFGTSARDGRNGEELAASAAPLVECGKGHEAIVEQVVVDGDTVSRIRCRAIESPRAAVATSASPVRVAPRPAPAVAAPSHEEARVTEGSSRSIKDSALIIGGATGAGAGIGAIAGGKKGAALGAAIGGVTGTVYDLSTRKKK